MRANIGAHHRDQRTAQSEHQGNKQIFNIAIATALVGALGPAAIAGYGVGTRLVRLVCTVMSAATAPTRRMSAKRTQRR